MVLITGLILIFLTSLADLVMYKSFRKHFGFRKKFKVAWSIQSLLCSSELIALLLLFNGHVVEMHLLVWGLFIYFLVSIPKVIYLLYWPIAVMPFSKLSRVSKITTLFGAVLALTLFLFILHGGIFGSTRLTVEKETIVSDRIPKSFDGLRIVQFSDYHLGGFTKSSGYVEEVTQRINALRPDIVLFTGDLVNSLAEEAHPFLPELAGIKATFGVYSVLGNHDYGDYHPWESAEAKKANLEALKKLQHDAGWKLLNNENVLLVRSGDTLAIAGVENWGDPPFGKHGDLSKALAGINPEWFTVLLSHNPVHWREEVIPKSNADLTLSGHTHAMQIKAGPFSPAVLRYKEWGGLYKEKDQYLYVNRGLGFVLLPMRIGAYPELTLIELKSVK